MTLELTDNEVATLGQAIISLWGVGGIEEKETMDLLTKIEQQHEGPCKEILESFLEERKNAALIMALYHVK